MDKGEQRPEDMVSPTVHARRAAAEERLEIQTRTPVVYLGHTLTASAASCLCLTRVHLPLRQQIGTPKYLQIDQSHSDQTTPGKGQALRRCSIYLDEG
jgi:hypothetical protein